MAKHAKRCVRFGPTNVAFGCCTDGPCGRRPGCRFRSTSDWRVLLGLVVVPIGENDCLLLGGQWFSEATDCAQC